jgi:hypothetical protein
VKVLARSSTQRNDPLLLHRPRRALLLAESVSSVLIFGRLRLGSGAPSLAEKRHHIHPAPSLMCRCDPGLAMDLLSRVLGGGQQDLAHQGQKSIIEGYLLKVSKDILR